MTSSHTVYQSMPPSHVSAIEWQLRELILPAVFTTARTTYQRRAALILQIQSESGMEGAGEVSPLPGYSPDSFAECLQHLQSTALLERAQQHTLQLLPDELAAPEHVRHWLEAWLALVPESLPSLRFGLETALLRLLSQHWRLSLHQCLNRVLRPVGQTPSILTSACLVELMAVEQSLPELKGLYARGQRLFKFKVGRVGRLDEELDHLTGFLKHMPPDVKLRLDANGTLGVASLHRLLDVISLDRIEAIEEPWDLLNASECGFIRTVTKETLGVPILLDESLQRVGTWPRVEWLLSQGIIAGLVLKPTTLGGLLSCWQWAGLARRSGAYAFVTHTHEGPLGFDACQALAQQFPMDCVHGLDERWVSTYSAVQSPAGSQAGSGS